MPRLAAVLEDRKTNNAGPPAGSDALWGPLEQARGQQPFLHVWDGQKYQPHTWDEWRAAAEASARGLRRAGVRRGSRVAAVLTNSFSACAAVIGTWLNGATLISLPTPPRGVAYELYAEMLAKACGRAKAELLLLEEQYVQLLADGSVGTRVSAFESLADPGRMTPDLPGDDDVAFVQFSSGSTREPRGCMLTPRAIAAQLELLSTCIGVGPDRQGVSWLPLSHDMGLFGILLLAWSTGTPLALGPPERFLRSPRSWLQDCADFQATDTAAPNFALALATRAAAASPPSRPFPLRGLVLGGERIEWDTVATAMRVLGSYGVTAKSITPAYGLAEATLAVTATPADTPAHAMPVDADALVNGRVERCQDDHPGASWIVSCGKPLPSVEVQAGTGDEPHRIRIKSPSLASGYLDDAPATAEAFRNGEFITEDLGLLHDGELYVLGRTDDMLIVGGRKFYARDVESTLGQVPGVRAGSCVLVDIPNGDRRHLVVVLEQNHDGVSATRIAAELRRCVYETAGVRLTECIVVERGSLPKTPSGKVQRFRCRELVVNDAPSIMERARC